MSYSLVIYITCTFAYICDEYFRIQFQLLANKTEVLYKIDCWLHRDRSRESHYCVESYYISLSITLILSEEKQKR